MLSQWVTGLFRILFAPVKGRGRHPMNQEQITISSLIATTFAVAAQKNPGLPEAWVRVSFRLGGLLPKSRLTLSIQQEGNVDALLRTMEDERAAGQADQETMFAFHYQVMLSELWVGRFYEHLRLLVSGDRKLLPKSGEIGALAEDFRLLRVPIEKHEIASDGQLSAPLQMQRRPVQGRPSDVYEYDKTDPQRAHIMPVAISPRGSVMWEVIDLKNNKDLWIERRALSDRIIGLWGDDKAASASG